MKKTILVPIFLLALCIASSGCITKSYVNDSGEQCQRKIKFFLLFFKTSYSCEPKSES
jgi:hypothetical protein